MKKSAWLNKKVSLGACHKVKALLRELNLSTVCEEALCPNISECFSGGVATFMILGNICTRNCSFCSVTKKRTPAHVESDEPRKIHEAVKRLNLQYVVVTSVTRDDLPDFGADHFYKVITEIKKIPFVKGIEALIPDFNMCNALISRVLDAKPSVVAHNVETVPSLYEAVRPDSGYEGSLSVLKTIKEIKKDIFTKSALLLGMGETVDEVKVVLRDLRGVGCDFVSVGQYLAPSKEHYPVKEYVTPDVFDEIKRFGESIGFKRVMSAPYVRSSYQADTYL